MSPHSAILPYIRISIGRESYGMPAKRATVRRTPEQGLTKAEACKILQVAPTADEELITQAYWHQARKFRATARTNPESRLRLDELNRAYLVLNPAGGEAPLSGEIPPIPERTSWMDDFTSWLRRLVEETAARWPGRSVEMAILSGATAVLTLLALSAGASALAT